METLPFGQLESLTLIDLPSLVSICPDSHEIVWPSLRFVCIEGCPQLKTSATFTQTVARKENFNASSSSYSTCDVANSTSKKDSTRFLQCCLGCTPRAFSRVINSIINLVTATCWLDNFLNFFIYFIELINLLFILLLFCFSFKIRVVHRSQC